MVHPLTNWYTLLMCNSNCELRFSWNSKIEWAASMSTIIISAGCKDKSVMSLVTINDHETVYILYYTVFHPHTPFTIVFIGHCYNSNGLRLCLDSLFSFMVWRLDKFIQVHARLTAEEVSLCTVC